MSENFALNPFTRTWGAAQTMSKMYVKNRVLVFNPGLGNLYLHQRKSILVRLIDIVTALND